MRAKGLIKSFLDLWEEFYLSLDGESLHIYEKRTDHEEISSIRLLDIKGLTVELSGNTFDANKKHNSLEDRYIITLSTVGWDVVRIQ